MLAAKSGEDIGREGLLHPGAQAEFIELLGDVGVGRAPMRREAFALTTKDVKFPPQEFGIGGGMIALDGHPQDRGAGRSQAGPSQLVGLTKDHGDSVDDLQNRGGMDGLHGGPSEDFAGNIPESPTAAQKVEISDIWPWRLRKGRTMSWAATRMSFGTLQHVLGRTSTGKPRLVSGMSVNGQQDNLNSQQASPAPARTTSIAAAAACSLLFFCSMFAAIRFGAWYTPPLLGFSWIMFFRYIGVDLRLLPDESTLLRIMRAFAHHWIARSAFIGGTFSASVYISFAVYRQYGLEDGAAVAVSLLAGWVVFAVMLRRNPALWYRKAFLIVLMVWGGVGFSGIRLDLLAEILGHSVLITYSNEVDSAIHSVFALLLVLLLLMDYAARRDDRQPRQHPSTTSLGATTTFALKSLFALSLVGTGAVILLSRLATNDLPGLFYGALVLTGTGLVVAIASRRTSAISFDIDGWKKETWGWSKESLLEPYESEVLIVFVHGILSGPKMWRSTLGLSPPLDSALLSAFHADAYIFEYSSFPCFTGSTQAAAKDLRTALDRLPSRYRHIVFVAHSHGGLVVKQFLADDSQTESANRYVARVREIINIAVPHRGGQGWLQAFCLLFDLVNRAAMPFLVFVNRISIGRWRLGHNTIFATLSPNNKALRDLTEKFLSYRREEVDRRGLFPRVVDIRPSNDVIADLGDPTNLTWVHHVKVPGGHLLSLLPIDEIRRETTRALQHVVGTAGILLDRIIKLNRQNEEDHEIEAYTISQALTIIGVTADAKKTRAFTRIVVAGDAGSGKTRALAHLGRTLATRCLSEFGAAFPIVMQLQRLSIDDSTNGHRLKVDELVSRILDRWIIDTNERANVRDRKAERLDILSSEWVRKIAMPSVVIVDGVDNFLSKHPEISPDDLMAAIDSAFGIGITATRVVTGIRTGTVPELWTREEKWNYFVIKRVRSEELDIILPELTELMAELREQHRLADGWERAVDLVRLPLILFALRRQRHRLRSLLSRNAESTSGLTLADILSSAMRSIIEGSVERVVRNAAVSKRPSLASDVATLDRVVRFAVRGGDAGDLEQAIDPQDLQELKTIPDLFVTALTVLSIAFYSKLAVRQTQTQMQATLDALCAKWEAHSELHKSMVRDGTPSVVTITNWLNNNWAVLLSCGLFNTEGSSPKDGSPRWVFGHAYWQDYFVARYVAYCIQLEWNDEIARYGYLPNILQLTGDMVESDRVRKLLDNLSEQSPSFVCNVLAICAWTPAVLATPDSVEPFLRVMHDDNKPAFVRSWIMNGICFQILDVREHDRSRYDENQLARGRFLSQQLGMLMKSDVTVVRSQAWFYQSAFEIADSCPYPVDWDYDYDEDELVAFVGDVKGTLRQTLQDALCILADEIMLNSPASRGVAGLHYTLFLVAAARRGIAIGRTYPTLQRICEAGSPYEMIYRGMGDEASALYDKCRKLFWGSENYAYKPFIL